MTRIINGGIELGLLIAAQETGELLTQADVDRIEYLDSLPKGTWIASDGMQEIKDGDAVTLLAKRFVAQGGAQ